MIVLLVLLLVLLYLTASKTSFFKRKPKTNQLITQVIMAITVGVITISTLMLNDAEPALKYTVAGVGIMSFIAILTEVIQSIYKRYHES